MHPIQTQSDEAVIPDEAWAAATRSLADAEPREVLRWASDTFGDRVALACSFGIEDVVLLDMAMRVRREFPVFAIDTGRLPEETFAVAEAWRRRGARIRWYVPDRAAVEEMVREHGTYSFRQGIEERRLCCRLRKVEPLARALAGLGAWVTGLRREQGITRAMVQVLERDEGHGGIAKLNPLAPWSAARVWDYARAFKLPYNALHDRGYPSIGCAPCTRAVQPGEHPRAGRWWWESPEHRECGLHLSPVAR